MTDVTRILSAVQAGDEQSAEQLLPLVYDELHKLAAARVLQERADHSLNATALVHEAYLRLIGDQRFDNRGHFFAAAAEAMRRILVDRARQRGAIKHGGGRRRVPLADVANLTTTPDGLLALDEVLEKFSREDPKKAELVKLRFFVGMTMPEAAAALDISLATAERWWAFSKAWLFAELSDPE
jgi:RNA polymerase sigma factor (TIGR02999 family)